MLCALRTLFCQRSSLFVFLLSLVYGLYLVCGAVLFSRIESNQEQRTAMDYMSKKNDFSKRWNITEQDLDRFLESVSGAKSLVKPVNEKSSKWDFDKALLYVIMLITAIGGGETSTVTDEGKVLSIVYAAIGIPLTMLLFTALIERVNYLAYVPVKSMLSRRGAGEGHVRTAVFVSSLFNVTFLFYLVPTLCFYYIEKDWSLLDSFYFCFMSLATIGIGNFVPGQTVEGTMGVVYILFVSVYLLAGVLMVSYLISLAATLSFFDLSKYYHIEMDVEDSETRQLIRRSSLFSSSFLFDVSSAGSASTNEQANSVTDAAVRRISDLIDDNDR